MVSGADGVTFCTQDSRLSFDMPGASTLATWGTILAPWEHPAGPWEQQAGNMMVWRRIRAGFGAVLGIHFESCFGTED